MQNQKIMRSYRTDKNGDGLWVWNNRSNQWDQCRGSCDWCISGFADIRGALKRRFVGVKNLRIDGRRISWDADRMK